jgi:hypothetical protein
LVDTFPAPIQIQMRTPKIKENVVGSLTPLSDATASGGSTSTRLGHHNDCFLASSSDFGTYANVATEKAYLEKDAKYTSMGGEVFNVVRGFVSSLRLIVVLFS